MLNLTSSSSQEERGMYADYAYTLNIPSDKKIFCLEETVRLTAAATVNTQDVEEDPSSMVLFSIFKYCEIGRVEFSDTDWDLLNKICRTLPPLELGMPLTCAEVCRYQRIACFDGDFDVYLVTVPNSFYRERKQLANERTHREELRRQIAEGLIHVVDSVSGLRVTGEAGFNGRNKIMRDDFGRFCRTLHIELKIQERAVSAYWRDLPALESRAAMLKEFRGLGGKKNRSGNFAHTGALKTLCEKDGRSRTTVSAHLTKAYEDEKNVVRGFPQQING